tara:strand:+ start:373 stop:1368 length:996 start_codon:yes stop_codon:yes gene_type:complete
MGFFAGVVNELNRIEDRGERRAEFMAALLEKRKNTVIPTLVERLNAEKEDLAERRERVQQAMVLGLTKKASAVLESSGALELELDRLKKLNEKGELNREALKKISQQIVESVPEEKVADALDYVIKGDLTFTDMPSQNDTLIAAMYNATTVDEFTQAYTKAITPLQKSTVKRIQPFDYTTRGADVITPSESSSARTTIAKSIAQTLGVGIIPDANGNFLKFQGKDEDAAQTVLNNAYDMYENLYESPTYFDSPTKIINDINTRINVLRQQGQEVKEIARNPTFDTSITIEVEPPDPNQSLNNPRQVRRSNTNNSENTDEDDIFNNNRLNRN